MSVKYGLDIDFKKDPVGSVVTIILYLGAIYIIYQVIKAIIGYSWDPITILFSAIFLVIINMFRIEHNMGVLKGETREFRANVKESFDRIREDFSKFDNRLERIDNRLEGIEKSIRSLSKSRK